MSSPDKAIPDTQAASASEQDSLDLLALNVLLHERTQERDLFDTMIAAVGSARPQDAVLESLLRCIMTATSCQGAAVYFYQRENGSLLLQGVVGRATPPVMPQQLSLDEGVIGRAARTMQTVQAQEQEDGAADPAFLLATPLLTREQALLGVVSLVSTSVLDLSPYQQTFLQRAAVLVAEVYERTQLRQLLTHDHFTRSFFDLLLEYPREQGVLRLYAGFLGVDLDAAHCIALLELGVEKEARLVEDIRRVPHSVVDRVSAHLRTELDRAYPHSLLFERELVLACLIQVDLDGDPSGSQLMSWLRTQYFQLNDTVLLSIGLSNPSQLGDYRRAFAEAGQALQRGYSINPQGGVLHYNDLRLYEYLTHFTRPEDLGDPYQEKIGLLARYKGSNERLLETLETFLECSGNLAETSSRLAVHRNTVEQRVRRIEEITGMTLLGNKSNSVRFDLQLALRLYKLRKQQ